VKFEHSTIEQLGTRLRERFATATGAQAARIAEWLAGRSDAELRAWFAMSAGQVAQLRGRLNQQVAALISLGAVRGE
jgi:hypothetical protein